MMSRKFTFLKKASFSFSSLAEEDPGEIIRALPSSSSSEASVFYSHVDKSTWLLHFFKVLFDVKYNPLYQPRQPRPIWPEVDILWSQKGWNGCWKHVCYKCKLLCCFAGSIYYLPTGLYHQSCRRFLMIKMIASRKVGTFKIQQARALLLKLAVHFFTHIA